MTSKINETRIISAVRVPLLPCVTRIEVVHRNPDRPRQQTSRSSRGRRAVFWGISLFVMIQVSMNLAIRQDIVPVRDPIWFEKLQFLQRYGGFFPEPFGDDRAVPRRLLALGSSRTQLAFNASRLQCTLAEISQQPIRAFNFGCPAAGAMTCALYFRRLLDMGCVTDELLVEIHPGFIAEHEPPFEGRWLHLYRLSEAEVQTLRGFGWALEDPPQHSWKGWLTAAGSYRMSLLNRYAPVLLPCPYGLTLGSKSNADGFVCGVEMPRDRYVKALARTRQEYAPVLENYRVGGPGPAAIRDILAICRARGIAATVILMPESSEHREWYGVEGHDSLATFIASLKREFEIPVIDAREWVPDEGFADGHHLTGSGATIFTDRLACELCRHRQKDSAVLRGAE